MCRRRFNTDALHTAHKRPRFRCSEDVRLDPYIVFPLCVFGCDHLYEKGFITVRNGHYIAGRPASATETEIIRGLIDKPVPDRWLKGPADYFDNLQF